MNVRLANIEDMPILMEIYQRARAFMRQTGNVHQWPPGYPSYNDILKEIENQRFYVMIEDGQIQASFVYYQGIDPCYNVIYDGQWLNDEPYAVLHKVATRGLKRHMGEKILNYAFARNQNVRIDTHEDNKPMQHLLTTHGFKRTGTIILANGEPRWSYHWCKDCNFK